MTGTQSTEAPAPAPQPPKPPPPTRDNPFPTPWPGGPTYSALDLMGEVYLGLWGAGKIPAGPMRDPAAAQQACANLLRAFGVTPTEVAPTADPRSAIDAVAMLCGVAA